MRNAIKSILLFGLILSCFTGGWRCNGGKVPEIGQIQGPKAVDEYERVEFWISLENASDATFLWSCDPADAGEFDKADFPKTGFTASMVTHDTPVKITVVVDSLQFTPIVLSKKITIRDVTKLSIGEIEGPDTVAEGSSVDYSIVAAGDTGIKYQWSAIPNDMGIFATPQQAVTQFTAGYVDGDASAEIQVSIQSDNYGPFLIKKEITIKDKGWPLIWGGYYNDYGNAVAIDGNGNIFVVGGFQGTIDFDPGPGVYKYKSNGGDDIFLSKFDSKGEFQWARIWGGINSEWGDGVAIDGNGNSYVTGFFESIVDFDPGPGVDQHKASGYPPDAFLSKFDSNGGFQWARTWGGGNEWDEGNAVAIDGSGNAYVAGIFWDTVDFDPGFGVDEHTSNGEDDIFLSKFDSNGEFLWARTWGGYSYDRGYGVAIDGSGNAYVSGDFCGTVDFDPGPGVDEHISDDHISKAFWDASLSKFDSNGGFLWARTWGGDLDDHGYGVAIDGSGNAYVTGSFRDTADFDPGPGVDLHTTNGGGDVFLSKFDSYGEFQWARTWGGIYYDTGQGIAIDGSGNAYITGRFEDAIDFDPGPGVDEHTAKGHLDTFLSKFDLSGEFQWARTWGGDDMVEGNAVATDGSGNAYVTGDFSGGVDFDPGLGVDMHTSNGYSDAFLNKFPPDGNW